MTGPEPFTGLRFQLLGPLRAWRGATELDLGQMQQRVVLAVLLLHADAPISRDQLVDAVWGQAVPARAANLLQRHVSGLRRALEPERPPRAPSGLLNWTEAGYLLTLGAGRLDVRAFDELIDRAHAARARGELTVAAQALHRALGLWHGRLCEGMTSPLLDTERDRLTERRLSVLEERIEVDLALGDDFDLVGEVRQLTVDHPLREDLHALLMLALHRAGRQAEALAAYHHARALLRGELGVEPGRRLRQAHARILAADPGGDIQPVVARAPAPTVVPAQLPHPLSGFVGREEALERLDAMLPDSATTRGTVVVSAIGGTAGVGKTALAVHWAHRVRDRFPDGQLYVNLRGYDPGGRAVRPSDAIRGFLDALGVPPERVPVDPQSQAGLYRSLLANRRMLVLLDNAQDADHVRPLLPGSPDCLSVITSRNRLTGLMVTDGAQPVVLGLMSDSEARDILAGRIGRQRLAAAPDAVRDIVASCARLPLALAVVAAYAATHPQLPLDAVAKELHAAGGALDLLGGTDAATDVRKVFSWSYRRLTGPTARLFRLLGLQPGPDIGFAAAAGLADLAPGQIRPLLDELTDSHLVTRPEAGRYGFHDLLRSYAAELAETHEPPAVRHAAVHRLLDHYLRSAYRASLRLNPNRDDPITLPLPGSPAPGEDFDDHDAALAWFRKEHAVLVAVQQQAQSTGLDAHAWQLGWTLRPYLDRRGHWQESETVYRRALESARRTRSAHGQAVSHGCLAYAYMRLSRYEDVATHLWQALDLYETLDDPLGQAHSHRTLAWLGDQQGQYDLALDHSRKALALFETAGHRTGQARALNALGWFCSRLGLHQEALVHCERALRLHEEAGDRFAQADTWDSLGHVHHHLGGYAQGVDCYRRALAIYRQTGDRYNEADTLSSLGDLHLAAGDPGAAREAWGRAVMLLEELGHPRAAEIRANLGADPEPNPLEKPAT
ncbi:BTAD domain-containing putative transcriptional regulator [Streptomyces sp. NPDC047081]|uniref:AfsR/SARP family transcriptional regulator n=1 Tax=Streptomyces sp. NPDC047081 TaxID=3154706 RepID=UPI0033CA7823